MQVVDNGPGLHRLAKRRTARLLARLLAQIAVPPRKLGVDEDPS